MTGVRIEEQCLRSDDWTVRTSGDTPGVAARKKESLENIGAHMPYPQHLSFSCSALALVLSGQYTMSLLVLYRVYLCAIIKSSALYMYLSRQKILFICIIAPQTR